MAKKCHLCTREMLPNQIRKITLHAPFYKNKYRICPVCYDKTFDLFKSIIQGANNQ